MLERHEVVLDGEVVAVSLGGHPDFGRLQHRHGAPSRFAQAKAPTQYSMSDVLRLDGRSLLGEQYRVRRQLLAYVIARLSAPVPRDDQAGPKARAR